MNITIVGASNAFARGIADWAVAARHDITIVGHSLAQAQAFVASLGAGTAAGPESGLHTQLIFAALPYACLLDMWEFYREQLDGRTLLILGADLSVVRKLSKERPSVKVLGLRIAPETSAILIEGDDEEANQLVTQLFQEHAAL
jgi:predicted dinucleotide-binding enzyme